MGIYNNTKKLLTLDHFTSQGELIDNITLRHYQGGNFLTIEGLQITLLKDIATVSIRKCLLAAKTKHNIITDLAC